MKEWIIEWMNDLIIEWLNGLMIEWLNWTDQFEKKIFKALEVGARIVIAVRSDVHLVKK